MNTKFLNALSLEWKIKVFAIEEANDLSIHLVIDIVSTFIKYKMNEAWRNPPTGKKEN